MRGQVAAVASLLLAIVVVAIFLPVLHSANADTGDHFRPPPTKTTIARTSTHSTQGSHGRRNVGSTYSPASNCTIVGGLAYNQEAQGLYYGHGLAQTTCPSPTPTPGRNTGPRVTIDQLILEAQTGLAPPKPFVKTAPPRGKRELVGIPTWFWLDKSQWDDRTSSASAGSLYVSVTASAYELVIDPGDGSDALVCKAPWTPYKGNPSAASDCTHTYTHSGNYTVAVSAKWGADWSGSGGAGGTLPTISRSATFPVNVVQARSELIANP